MTEKKETGPEGAEIVFPFLVSPENITRGIRNEASELMETPTKDLPQYLGEMIRHYADRYGLCGELVYEVMCSYIWWKKKGAIMEVGEPFIIPETNKILPITPSLGRKKAGKKKD